MKYRFTLSHDISRAWKGTFGTPGEHVTRGFAPWKDQGRVTSDFINYLSDPRDSLGVSGGSRETIYEAGIILLITEWFQGDS